MQICILRDANKQIERYYQACLSYMLTLTFLRDKFYSLDCSLNLVALFASGQRLLIPKHDKAALCSISQSHYECTSVWTNGQKGYYVVPSPFTPLTLYDCFLFKKRNTNPEPSLSWSSRMSKRFHGPDKSSNSYDFQYCFNKSDQYLVECIAFNGNNFKGNETVCYLLRQ